MGLTFQSEDISSTIDALSRGGIQFERFAGMKQDRQGTCTFPGGAKVAWFKDPDGNMLSLTEC